MFKYTMPNANEKSNLEQDLDPYLNAQANWRSNRGDVQSLMKRLKENKQREDNGKFIFLMTAVSVVVISGIIISF